MGTYAYTLLETEADVKIPAARLMKVQLSTPGNQPDITVDCTAFLDTGADCTLVAFEILAQIQATRVGAKERIFGTGRGSTIVVPYLVGLRFDRYFSPVVRVRGCASEELGGIVLIGRDLLNQYCIEFKGPALTFTVQ